MRLLYARNADQRLGPAAAQASTSIASEIRIAMSGNLCRCTGYQGIVRSIRSAAENWAGKATADQEHV